MFDDYKDDWHSSKEHKLRHIELYEFLDELVGDWVFSTGALLSKTSVLALMEWSKKQTKNPNHRVEYVNETNNTDQYI